MQVFVAFNVILGLCMAKEPTLILRYEEQNDCLAPYIEQKVSSKAPLNVLTFCGEFAFKYLNRAELVSMPKIKTQLTLYDFEKKFGFSEVFGSDYMFLWPSITLQPDQWIKVCFISEETRMQVRLNILNKGKRPYF